MNAIRWTCALLAVVLTACPGPSTNDGGTGGGATGGGGGGGGGQSGGGAGGGVMDAGPAVFGLMTLYEETGTLSVNGASTPVKLMEASASFGSDSAHAYDDRLSSGLGCVADHYDAAHPRPKTKDAGSLRMTGYAGGTLLLTGSPPAAQPIVCYVPGDQYVCIYPVGAVVSDAPFAATAAPLGAGPIDFQTAAGGDFGAATVSTSPPAGTLSVQEDLTTVHYDTAADTLLHASCDGGCSDSQLLLSVTVTPSSADGGDDPRSGSLRCLFGASPMTVPHAAVTAMFGGDATLDQVRSAVVRVTAAASMHDVSGNLLVGQTGRGQFGVAPR